MAYNKYHNNVTHGFQSKKEYRRYQELLLLQKAGKIQGLECQVKFQLLPAQYEGKKCIYRSAAYIADFTYWMDHEFVVEDCKGFRTKEYQLKKKMMYYFHHIKIKEV